jgi:uncharacterized protein YbaR (Trm112 family)
VLSDDLLDILACPVCMTGVHQEGDELVCAECERRFPIRDGIPMMILDEPEAELEEDEAAGIDPSPEDPS